MLRYLNVRASREGKFCFPDFKLFKRGFYKLCVRFVRDDMREIIFEIICRGLEKLFESFLVFRDGVGYLIIVKEMIGGE